jgi:NAD(P)-dependent dehydrogenase (short-subunit alcohol dehydrogenase family)
MSEKKVLELFDLTGKVALVTGGNSGIGFGCALALAQAGAKVVIMARNEARCKSSVQQIIDDGGQAAYSVGDVTSYEDGERALKFTVDTYGSVDILVNNSGICVNKPAHEMTYEEYMRVMNVDLHSIFIMSTIVARYMIAQGIKGSMINITSMSADIVNDPQPQCAYNSAKAGANMLTKSFAKEWVEYGIRVNAIAPGYVHTPLLGDENSEIYQHWVACTPMKRTGTPQEMGALAVYFASDASTFTTGSVFRSDGGYTLI